MNNQEMIKKYETMAKTLLDVINHKEVDEIELEKALACRRFVVGFLYDLKQ